MLDYDDLREILARVMNREEPPEDATPEYMRAYREMKQDVADANARGNMIWIPSE